MDETNKVGRSIKVAEREEQGPRIDCWAHRSKFIVRNGNQNDKAPGTRGSFRSWPDWEGMYNLYMNETGIGTSTHAQYQYLAGFYILLGFLALNAPASSAVTWTNGLIPTTLGHFQIIAGTPHVVSYLG